MARVARDAGCPADQLIRFARAGYVPQPKQLQFHAAARACQTGRIDEVGFGGARGPGKSHALFAQMALDDCQRIAGLKCLYLRKVARQAREQIEDLRRAVLWCTPHDYRSHDGVITFPNGSRILIGHFHDEGDVDNYLGIQYDLIVIEETTTLTLAKYKTLRDSNRTSRRDWRPAIYNSTNPGGVGHAWYKDRFIKPARERRETTTRFVFGTVDDNKFIDAGYQAKLEENTGWKLRAYRYGDWDISAGQFFTNWDYNRVVIKPFDIPSDWPVWMAMDYGYSHYTVAYLFAADGDGNIYTVAEHAERGQLPDYHASQIKSMLARRGLSLSHLRRFVAGSDVFAARGTVQTIAEQYAALGIYLNPAQMDRINGAGRILALLGDADRGVKNRVYVFDTCARLIDCVPTMEHDPNRPEDVLKVDTDEDGIGGDDAYDAWRYGVMEQITPRGNQTDPFAGW